ncbi:hypothetical protein IBTHAUMO2_470039 [Nitrosopumilaceae archaeon]|nr:hypothetical protein IBTHAUMO2_470039 [Nitrosopumilaceae archaeon]
MSAGPVAVHVAVMEPGGNALGALFRIVWFAGAVG